MEKYILQIASELNIQDYQVRNVIKLLESDCTIPFIARYRKEMTGSLDEVIILAIKVRYYQLIELEKRRNAILESIKEQEKLTPELEQKLMHALTLSELEDLYLPYKPKRKTRATIAKAKGLEPLAMLILNQNRINLHEKAEQYIDAEKGVNSIEEALQGARDIIAETVNEDSTVRAKIRRLYEREAIISTKVVKDKELEGEKYEQYFEFSENIVKAPSHRILAMFRGENEGFLRLKLEPEEEKALDIIHKQFVKGNNDCSEQVEIALKDSYKRLLSSSIETEIRQTLKEKADKEAINVFAENLRQLLMAAPLGPKTILAIDPGFRTGCKVVCIDKQGNLLHNETIYPHQPQSERKAAASKIQTLVKSYKIEAIAIGNGTAGRETEAFIRAIPFDRDLIAIMVNESGASVYSASDIAREEFPDYDVTVRGAVSIGRRLMDPLAELVKIDPKSIGVGQYQHDVDQKLLHNSLDNMVVSVVNSVGVDINTASKQLLTYVSGLGPSLAQNIVEFRAKNGAFKSRKELKKVARFGDKAFEQAAGFCRILEPENLLDKSAVHPESYHIVEKMAKDLNCSIQDLISNADLRKQIDLKKYITENVGLPTLQDIVNELAKPGRDPRKKFEMFEFDKNVHSMNDLVPGMVLPGIITNITAFGAFVDIGVHQDGLVHISHLSNTFVSNPNDAVKLYQHVTVKVLEVDVNRKRISLSMKEV